MLSHVNSSIPIFQFQLLPDTPGMKISSPTGDFRNPENATAGCISGFFRRLLCRNLATVQSSSDFEDFSRTGSSPPREEAEEELKEKKFQAEIATPSPNIVAKLMGLESMPEFDWMPRTPDSIGRSRSANSLHSWVDSDPIQLKNHRRVKTSSSFREVPTFLRQENDDFLLLSFELDSKETPKTDISSIREVVHEKKRDSGKHKEKEIRTVEKKNKKASNDEFHRQKNKNHEEMVSGRKKVTGRRASPSTGEDNGRGLKSKQNRGKRSEAHVLIQQDESSSHSSLNRSKVNTRKEEIDISIVKKADSESSSENSSPVSVLDRPFEAETDFLASEQDWRQKAVEPRKRVSSSKANSVPLLSSSTGRELKTEKKEGDDGEVQFDQTMGRGILILPEDDIVRDLNWGSKDWWKAGEFDEARTEIGMQILESLLHDLVDELSTPCFNLSTGGSIAAINCICDTRFHLTI